MKKTYFQPMTKAMSLNLSSTICTEQAVVVSETPETTPTDEPAPMF